MWQNRPSTMATCDTLIYMSLVWHFNSGTYFSEWSTEIHRWQNKLGVWVTIFSKNISGLRRPKNVKFGIKVASSTSMMHTIKFLEKFLTVVKFEKMQKSGNFFFTKNTHTGGSTYMQKAYSWCHRVSGFSTCYLRQCGALRTLWQKSPCLCISMSP